VLQPDRLPAINPRILRSAFLLATIFAIGTAGYMVIEGVGAWDAFYMTAITLTTVGYREVFPLSRGGEAFTVFILVAGLGLILLVATSIGRAVVEGELQALVGDRRRTRMIETMSSHEIVCGWGRMGKAVVAELRRAGRQVVVIEQQAEKIERLRQTDIPCIAGDATAENVLVSAGIQRARGLVACLNDDAHNVYTVLTARSLNSTLMIVARAGEEGADARLVRAGADRVVNPYQHSGIRLAHVLLKPTVVDFLDLSRGAAGSDLELEQVRLAQSSELSGNTLGEADLRHRCGVGVVAIERDGHLTPNPEAAFRLEAGDLLVVLGRRGELDRLEAMAEGATKGA